ncbi:acyl-CoA thioesterase domain-containing protein [Spongiactinospora sp. TRM90649]|uniref:acyl-CoA thioesterase domain-containing protein n=1 Tax=Spongiactinospora sp. TRM90649 TaxID=3031114 RepID=UPI0023FA2BC1|nr:acyl-CoA thioesterase domain-containing protein [Spongiactinospora sp. TRM90649]MDF5758191.1 thioesterase family protein [Spongiactinospora sp. TRM90649]
MAETGERPAFFTERNGEFVPFPIARSPWARNMLHGRLIGGLAARAVEREHAAEGLTPARVTVDLFRNAPLTPLRVTSRRVRDGRRIRLVDVEIANDDGVIGRVSIVLLRTSAHPPGEVWIEPPAPLPPPTGLFDPSGPVGGWQPSFALWWPPTGPDDRRAAWLRETYALVAGEPLTPLIRVAMAADFASPLSHSGSQGLQFINADYTLTLARTPRGEAIGLEATGQLGADGVASGLCVVHDEYGPIGHCLVTAIANPRLGG